MKIKLLLASLLYLCISVLEKTHAQTQPIISSFAPLTSLPGTSLTITGSNFNATASNNIVFFGAVRATVTLASVNSLTVTVPANATHSPISVLNTGTNLSGYSLKYFLPKFLPVRPSALITGDFTLTGHISNPAYGMTSADLNDDGKPEIVATANAPGNNSIYIRQNTSTAGTISFGSAINNIATGTDRLEGKPSIGDIDGDGRPDIVTPGYDTDNFAVMLNTGSFSGFAPTVFATGDRPTATNLGDFDSDGKIDVVVSNYSDLTISVFRNTSSPGSVSFASAVTFSTGGSVGTLVVADFNSDGKPDILGTRGTFNLIRVFQNSTVGGTINFSLSDITVMDHPSSLTAGDMDSDGDLDLIVTSEDVAGTNFGILTNTSVAGITFTFQQIDVGSHQSHAALTDLNGDGKADLLLGLKKDFGSFTYRLAVLTNITTTGAITFSSRIELAAQRSPINVIAADMNGDGRPDLLSSNVQFGTITVYRNTLQYPPAITAFSPAKASPGASVTLTGSGFNNTMANNIVYFGPVKGVVTAASASSLTVTVPLGATHSLISVLNTGTGMSGLSLSTFLPVFTPNKSTLRAADIAARATIPTLSGPYALLAADFDGDGKPELLTNSTASAVRVHPNTSSSGTISFGTTTNLTVNSDARYSAVGDVDGDGKLDFAVTNLLSDNISIFRNSGSGTISFDAKIDIATGVGPVACEFADLDGDGRPELIVSNFSTNNISVFRNTTSGGAISFDPKVDITVGNSPGTLSVNDFDGDGKLDVAVTASNAASIVVLRSNGTGSISFDTPLSLSAGSIPWIIQSGDLDGDGKPDIAVTNLSSNNVTIYQNNSSSGATAFLPGVNYTAGVTPRGLSLGDINGDGRPDMVVANESSHTLSVFANSSSSGTVNFASPITQSISLAGPRGVTLADLDGDGRSDIAMGDGNASTISIFRNALLAAPAVQASGVSFSSTTATSTTINWTSGNGSSRIVWMKAENTGVPVPVDETTYTANAAFGSGNQIGSTGWYAVYTGTGSSVSVTGLTTATDYRVMVTEYNGAAGLELYQTAAATNNPVLLTTASTDARLSGITLSSGNLSPAFTAGTTSYSATVNPGTSSITATSVTNQGNASLEVRVNGGSYTAVTSGAASSALSLNNGTNTVDVKVTAQDGSTIKTYTVTVIRQINQVITFPVTANVAYGTADFDPGATSSNNGIVLTYASSDPAIATIVAGKVHIVKAGAVNITASQAGDGTYVAAPDKIQVLTIQPKSITLALNASPAITKTYDGSNTTSLATGNYILNGIETGDLVTVSGTASFDTKNAGAGKAVTVNTFVLAGAQKDNYSLLTTSSSTTGTITAKSITVSLNAIPAITKTYDGLTSATLVSGNYILNGIETGDLVTVSGTASFDTKNAGAGKTVTANTFVLAGAQKDNYSLSTISSTTTGTITAKSITLSLNASSPIAKTYDGSSTASLAAGNYTLNGIEMGDVVTVSGTSSFDTKNAGTGKTVTTNNFVLEGAQKDNYSLSTTSATTTGSIAPKSITLNLNSSPVVIKTYDGTSALSLAEANYALNGIVIGDVVKVSGTANFDTGNAGTGKTVTAGNFVLSGAQKDNYALITATAVTSGTIEKKILTVRADDQSKRQGEANPVFTMSYSGFISGEGTADLSVLPVASSTASLASASGTYSISPGGGSAANYNLTYADGTLTINPSAFVNTEPTLDAIPDHSVCYSDASQTILLNGITAGAGDESQNTIVTVSSTNTKLFSSLTIAKSGSGGAVLTYLVANALGGTARITVTVKDDGGTANGGSDSFSRSFDLVISSLPQARITSDIGTTVSRGSTVTLTASGGTSYIWATAQGIISGQNTAVLTVRPLQNTTYIVTATSGQGCTSVQSITINLLDDYKMVASNFLTPNGDGKNDTWVIKNIDAYPNNQVTVFDTAGRPVYVKKGYTNNQGWGGDVNGSTLSEGSYFYVIDFGGGERVFKGFITILKDR